VRVLVTGGVGFIGYHLTRALLARGDDVTVVDDFSDAPYPTAMKRRNERDLREELATSASSAERLRVVHACVTDNRALGPLVGAHEMVIHLAGLAGVRPSFADPARYSRVNVEGTANVLEHARAAGHARFVFASSSSVYGNSTPLPAVEDAVAIAPESPYAASKRGAELVSRALALRAPSMRITGLRFFTVYGPRQRPEMAITLFARAIAARRPIDIFGDGSMRRDFTHVDDIVRGIVAAADAAAPGFHLYNLGSGAPVTLTELVAALSAAVGQEARVSHVPAPLGDVDATYADIRKAQRELAWSPQRKLVDGLKTVAEWIRANPEL
jgi:UDP-glucuronate 4-epimerase